MDSKNFKYFTITTKELEFFTACIEKACYGVSKTTFNSKLPHSLRDIAQGDRAFLKLENRIICGPLFVSTPPDGIRSTKKEGSWYAVDDRSSRQDLLPSWIVLYPWCFFFDDTLLAQVNYCTIDSLSKSGISSLPPWGTISGETGVRLWQYVMEHGNDFADFIQRIQPTIRLSSPRAANTTVIPSRYKTKSGVLVRSKSECLIADWLFDHQIQFQYEKSILLDRRQIRPDFFLPKYDVFIEHLGLIHSNDSYREDWTYKLQLYRKHSVRLITLEEQDIQDIDKTLARKLKDYIETLT